MPPIDLALKVADQTLWRDERVFGFTSTQMHVIALARLVVVSYDAIATRNICKAVLVRVRRTFERLWQLPENKLGE